ncbi:MAG: hypothetical protein V3W34_16110 [Phycisphaerae bacterium]
MSHSTSLPEEPQLAQLRAFIIRASGGETDSTRLAECFALLDWLARRKDGRCPVRDLPPEYCCEILCVADEDGLIEFGHRKLAISVSTNTIELFPDWRWRSVTRTLGGSHAEILAVFAEEDARCEACHGFHPDVRWHVCLTAPVRKALAEWELSLTTPAAGGQAIPAGSDHPHPQRRGRGAPVVTDPKEDARIASSWETGSHRTYADCARELGLSESEVTHALDRHRHRNRKQ